MSSNNSIIVQIRRGTTAQTASFTGALAELTVDTDQKTIVVHDGVTPGGTTLSTKAFTQAAFDAANTATGTVGQLAFDKANSANVLAQAAFNAANNAQGTVGFLAFDKANGAYNQANTATTLAQNAFDAANNAQGTVGYLAFAKANAAFDVANTASNNITIIQGVDTAQNTRLTIIEGVDVGQNTRMSIIEGVDAGQNTSISAVDTYATGAFGKANSANVLAQAAFDAGNTSATLQSGINSTQNTNISAVDTYAGSAYNKANNALPLTGGSITGSLSVSQDLSVSGNLTVLGTTTTINTSSLVVNDSLLILGVGNYESDALDLGFSGHYNDGTNAHAGIIRDAGTKEFYVFKGYTPEHSANNNIDINHASFAKANVNADYVKGNLITNGVNIYTHTGAAFAQANTNAEQITAIQGVNTTQNTNISAVNTYATGAFNKANSANVLAQASFDAANTNATNITIIQGVDTTQNTNITIASNAAASAFTKANSANVLAQAAFDAANSISLGAISNVALTRSNSAIGTIPVTNSLKPGEPSINLNDGRMFIQLNNGQIIDISSTAAGNTWHVAMNGNDNFKGDTPSSAKASIRAAVAAAQPGDSVVVHSGTYNEVAPIIIPQNVQLQGSGERTCLIKPTTSSNNVFYVNNNSYVTGFKFVDYTGIAVSFPPRVLETGTAQTGGANTITLNSGAVTYTDYYKSMLVTITAGTGSGQSANVISYNGNTKIATVDANWSTQPDATSVYSLGIPLRTSPASSTSRYTTYITGSPYVYNSSSVTTTGTGIKIDGDLATGNKSIISAQFTQVNSGGTGVHVLNDGYTQLVSIYGIFCDTAFLAESGGTASLGNCNVNFGNKGLVANGKGKLAMTATVANTSPQASLTIDLNTVVANNSLGITATRPYVGLIMVIDTEPENYYVVTEATELAGGSTTVTFQSTIANTISSSTTVKFYQQSQLRASGQTFEYVGAGTSIASLPKLGGVANSAAQIITIGEGAVFATATDQSGNFSVSDLTINQSTSTITGRTFSKSLFAEMTPYILALES